MDCIHFFIEDSTKVCLKCGEEAPIENHFNIFRTKFVDFDKYLMNIEEDLKLKIIKIFDEITNLVHIRGKGRQSLMAVCFLYVINENGEKTTQKKVCKIFDVDRRKFSESRQIFLSKKPNFRCVDWNIGDYVIPLFDQFNLDLKYKNEVIESCSRIEENKKFVNYNPHSVCACIIIKILGDKLTIKKNIFIKEVGISEAMSQKILSSLN